MPPWHLLDEMFWAGPTGRKTRGRPKTHCKKLDLSGGLGMNLFAWIRWIRCLGREVWVPLLRLLPPWPLPQITGRKCMDEWINVCLCQENTMHLFIFCVLSFILLFVQECSFVQSLYNERKMASCDATCYVRYINENTGLTKKLPFYIKKCKRKILSFTKDKWAQEKSVVWFKYIYILRALCPRNILKDLMNPCNNNIQFYAWLRVMESGVKQ